MVSAYDLSTTVGTLEGNLLSASVDSFCRVVKDFLDLNEFEGLVRMAMFSGLHLMFSGTKKSIK